MEVAEMNRPIKASDIKETYTVLDFETTGLDVEGNQVLEIAAIKTDLEKEIGRLSVKVKLQEGKRVNKFLTEATGATDVDYANGIDEVAGMISLAAFMSNDTVVAHYAPFDFAFLKKWEITPDFFICTRSLARYLYPDESASLAPTCERLGIKLEGAHEAINDVQATAELLKKLMDTAAERGIRRKDYMNLVVDSEDRPNKFTPGRSTVIRSSELK